MSQQLENLHNLGPIVVAQQVVEGQENSAFYAYRSMTASKAYSTYIKVINLIYICWNGLIQE